MAGGAALTDYETAYEQVRGGGRLLPASAIAGTGAVGLRAAAPEAAPHEPEPSKLERTREVSELLLKKSNYRIIECDCGTKLKVPANLKRAKVKCPHCGRTHPL